MRLCLFFLLYIFNIAVASSIDDVIQQFENKKKNFTHEKIEEMIDSGEIKIKKPNKVQFNKEQLRPVFPVKYSDLSIGIVKKRSVQYPVYNSICLIGEDKYSFFWVKRYKPILIKKSVTCFYVSGSENGYKKLKHFLKPVSLSVVPVFDIINGYKIKHYPVLISGKIIEQGRLK